MKKVLSLIVVVFLSAQMFAQDHLLFKGVPIDGEITSFVQQLNSKGFTTAQKTNEGYWLTGIFSGKNCVIMVEGSTISKTVHTVYVMQEKQEDWATLKNNYSTLKKGLVLKYGEPSAVSEEFRSPYKEGDGHPYMAFKGGYADWMSRFETTNGTIDLYIREQDYGNLTVIVKYQDKVNSTKSIQELTEDL